MVKRWQDDECDPYMGEKPDGKYVLYSDYQALESEKTAYWTVLELLCERFPDRPIGDLPGSVDELREALREALDGWTQNLDDGMKDWQGVRSQDERISQLRSLYLGGEKEEEFSKQVQYVDGVAVGIQYGPKNKGCLD